AGGIREGPRARPGPGVGEVLAVAAGKRTRVVSLERPERPRTIDFSDSAPPRLGWPGPLLWTGAVLLYALVLTVQVGLPASISLPQSAIYLYSLAILSIPV